MGAEQAGVPSENLDPVVENRFSPEVVNQAIIDGKPIEVKVLRTGKSEPESGWQVWGTSETAGSAYVRKPPEMAGGKVLSKHVRLDDLRNWNNL